MHVIEANQERIVEAGGLTSLLMLLRSFEDETVRRVAAGAIANLAMNGTIIIGAWFVFCCPTSSPLIHGYCLRAPMLLHLSVFFVFYNTLQKLIKSLSWLKEGLVYYL